jgi:hypothetical protein
MFILAIDLLLFILPTNKQKPLVLRLAQSMGSSHQSDW